MDAKHEDVEAQLDPNDPLMVSMHKMGIPLTRKNYLDLHYFGNVPKNIPAEEEATFPAVFRKNTEHGKSK